MHYHLLGGARALLVAGGHLKDAVALALPVIGLHVVEATEGYREGIVTKWTLDLVVLGPRQPST